MASKKFSEAISAQGHLGTSYCPHSCTISKADFYALWTLGLQYLAPKHTSI